MIGFDLQKVVKLINLPQNYIIGMMLVTRKANSPSKVREEQLSLDVVFTDRF